MSTTDPKPARKQKQKEFRSQPAPNGTERLKTVVRRLPPNLPEEIFWQSVQAWVTDDTITWKSYHPGKQRTKRVNKEGVPSRAYIAFKNEAQVATFSRAYDGHLFRDKAGNESYAVVEYAPFQKVPTEKKKIDARNNTIDKDEDYLSFLETLKGESKTESVSPEALIAASQPPPPPTTTPLLEALKAEKSAQRDKEAILRNHAHYKDAAASGSSSKKEDAKKKAAAAVAAAQAAKPESLALTSKKAKKAAAAAAAQKAFLLAQAQDGHGSALERSPLAAAAAPASVKWPAPLPALASNTGHAPRHRPAKEPHGRPHSGRGDTSVTASAPVPTSGLGPGPSPVSGAAPPPSVTAENAPSSAPAGGPVTAQAQGQRKNRPVIGLGRHFEAALNSAGVAVSPGAGTGTGDRKRRDKGGESGSGAGAGTGPGSAEGGTAGKAGKQKHREERLHPHPPPREVVPSILQRPAEAGGPEVVIVQRPQSLEGPGEGSAGAGVSPSVSPGTRGSIRRGRGRGRGGHRGG